MFVLIRPFQPVITRTTLAYFAAALEKGNIPEKCLSQSPFTKNLRKPSNRGRLLALLSSLKIIIFLKKSALAYFAAVI